MPNVTMKARDTIAAKLAECFITIGSRRYNFMQMIDMEAKVEKTKTTVPRLGAIMAGRSPMMTQPVMRADRRSFSMTATLTAVC